jgi:acyl-CoA reductase-like NAD-dependent aldehyde dehydrogenase
VALETSTPYIGDRYLALGRRDVADVMSPHDGRRLARLATGTADDLDAATRSADSAYRELRRWPRHARRDLLDRIARVLTRERQPWRA